MNLRLLSSTSPLTIVLIALFVGGLAWWLYFRHLQRLGLLDPWTRSLPWLRGGAVFLIACSLAEPSIERRYRDGMPGHVSIVLDNSASMELQDAGSQGSRLERAFQILAEPNGGLLPQLRENFDLRLQTGARGQLSQATRTSLTQDDPAMKLLWRSEISEEQVVPQSLRELMGQGTKPRDSSSPQSATWQYTDASPIGDWLNQSVSNESFERVDDGEQVGSHEVVLLLSDGQSNVGSAVADTVERYVAAGIPAFTMGFGAPNPLRDVGIRGLEAPRQLYRTDTLHGKVLLNDYLEVDNYRIDLKVGETTIIELPVEDVQAGLREIEFSIPMAEVFDKYNASQTRGAEYSILPIPFTATIIDATGDQIAANNTSQLIVDVAAGRSRVLLIDGRSRWETRYLKNLFERDPFWQLDTLLEHATEPNTGPEVAGDINGGNIRIEEVRFEQYNLIILGDMPAESIPSAKLQEMVRYVETGGGLIFIDGNRQHLRSTDYGQLSSLLPVRWPHAAASTAEKNQRSALADVRVTVAGQSVEALQLPDAVDGSGRIAWSSLLPLHLVSRVEPLPGSEVLLDAVVEGDVVPQPLMITKRYGAGRVLFMASDETWRWRYKVGDLIHQRLWNQLARSTMRIPLRIQSEFMELDTGPSTIAVGEGIEIRCRLRQTDGSPALGKTPIVVVESSVPDVDGNNSGTNSAANRFVKRQLLLASAEIDGLYVSELEGLPAGAYTFRVEVDGYSADALNIRSEVLVQAELSNELLLTHQNVDLLKQLASQTGGEYFDESQGEALIEAIRPFSSGKLVTSVFPLWQSYLWFTMSLVLLVAEWIVRKRSGLV